LHGIADIGKNSKQAIFSLHRGNGAEAQQRLETAKHIAEELLPLIQANPSLRHGSFSNAVEEYAEGLCLRGWVEEGRQA
jgi:predicted translin family RNA/ssDNA-binding protein